jgi:hypothetical protein
MFGTKKKMISLVMLVVFCVSMVFTVATNAAQPVTSQATTTTTTTLSESEMNQLAKMADNYQKYLSQKDGKVTVDTKKMLKDGYSKSVVQYVEQYYKQNSVVEASGKVGQIKPQGKWGKVAKVSRWLITNYNKVMNKLVSKLPTKIQPIAKQYLTFETLTQAIDWYTQYTDSVHDFLVGIVNYCLPWWLEWATPAIVGILELIIPVL